MRLSFIAKIFGLLTLSAMSGITLAADTEKTDIAFLLRGYNDTTLYPTLESFRPEAALALAGLSELSFGKASTFEIFDGGVDVNGADYYSSETDIEAIDAALSGWVGEPWSYYLERDKDTGFILVDPSDEEVAVLQSLRAWLLENRIGAISGWQESALGSENFEWVSDKVLRYGETAAEKFLKNVRLPASLDPKDYKMIGIIFSSRDEYNVSAAMHSCYYLGVKDANGEPIDELTSSEEQISCFYSDYSPIFEHSAAFWEASNRYVTIHEAIHAYGQYGHDRDSQLSDFPYSVMNQGPSYDQYPIWNRIYIQQWVSDNLITDDRDQLSDYKGASDLAGKYILRLSYENNYDCTDEFGEPQRCKRYQENYDGTLVQYRTPFVRDGVSTNPAGVIFEPINDISDTTIPVVESAHVDNYVVDPETNSVSDEIVISFSENIALGEGQIILLKDALPVATIETQRLPVLPSMSPSSGYLTIDGKTLTIRFSTADSNPQYSVRFGPEAIIDWGGNGVIGQHCAQVNDATPAIADTDEDGIIDCTDAFPLDALETIDTDLDGTGDNADIDDDDDGVLDDSDAFSLDASEQADSDGDGVGDNADAFPLDANDGQVLATQFLQTTSTSQNITNLHILNSAETAQTFTGTLWDRDGNQLGSGSVNLGSAVPSTGRLILSSADLDALFGEAPWSGPAMLQVQGESIFDLMSKLISPSGLVSNTNCVREDRVLNIEGFESSNMTYVRLINTENQDTGEIIGTLYDAEGNVVGSANSVLAANLGPHQQVWIDRNELANKVGEQWNGESLLEVNQIAGLKLLNLNYITDEKTFFNFSCFEDNTSGTVYLQTTSTSQNVSFTHLVNTSDTAQQLTGTLYSKDGSQLGEANQPLHSSTIAPKGRVVISSLDIEAAFAISPWSGPAMLEVQGSDTFALMTKLTSPSGLISNTNCVRQDQVHNIGGYDQTDVTYVRFINTGDTALTNIRGSLYNTAGDVIGVENPILVESLAPKSHVWRNRDQLSSLVGDTWNGTASLKIANPSEDLRLLNLNYINNETFFNFSCYETGQ